MSVLGGDRGGLDDVKRQASLLKTGALQDAIFNSANFSSIATDASEPLGQNAPLAAVLCHIDDRVQHRSWTG